MTKPYTCPQGHKAIENEHGTPVCYECDLIATHFNARDKIVYSWSDRDEYESRCEALQDQLDAAFDHQYFDEW